MGNHRIAGIVGLIQIHVASLESVWLSMLHNSVSLLKWHLFILSISLLRVIGPCTFDGNIFNGTTLPIDITTTCYLWPSPGALIFVCLFVCLFVCRDVRGGSPKWPGHLYFGVDIILVKHHEINNGCKQAPIISWTGHYLSVNNSPIWQKKKKNENFQSGVLHLPQAQCKRTLLLGLIHASLQPWR